MRRHSCDKRHIITSSKCQQTDLSKTKSSKSDPTRRRDPCQKEARFEMTKEKFCVNRGAATTENKVELRETEW